MSETRLAAISENRLRGLHALKLELDGTVWDDAVGPIVAAYEEGMTRDEATSLAASSFHTFDHEDCPGCAAYSKISDVFDWSDEI